MEPQWFQAHAHFGLAGFLDLGHELCRSGKYEEASLAIRCLAHCPEPIDARALPQLALWFDGGICNWGHTDVLCGLVLEPALLAGCIARHDPSRPRRPEASPHPRSRSILPTIWWLCGATT